MVKRAFALFLPLLAIVGSAFAQHMLGLAWPTLGLVAFPVISIDSYLWNLLSLVLCFLAGRWTRRNVGTLAGASLMAIVPLLFFGLVLWNITRGLDHIAWSKPITLFMIATAIVPITGVTFGWWRGSVDGTLPTAA